MYYPKMDGFKVMNFLLTESLKSNKTLYSVTFSLRRYHKIILWYTTKCDHKILWLFPQNATTKFVVDFVVDFVVGAFSVKWKKSLKFHKKSKVDVVAGVWYGSLLHTKQYINQWCVLDVVCLRDRLLLFLPCM